VSRVICVVTGSRAEYGLLRPVLSGIERSTEFSLMLVVTGTHLDQRFGATADVIESDGFVIDARVELQQAGDDPQSIAEAIARGVSGFGRVLSARTPDLVMILGDRFEILAVAQACLIYRVPVAHIAGGDVTEGAWDESIRHAVTKLSHLHLVTNEAAESRVRQLGEDPRRIHRVGSPGIDALRELKLLSSEELANVLGIELQERNFLVTYHPETLDELDPVERLESLLDALDALPGPSPGLWFTMPNADEGGLRLMRRIEEYVSSRPHAHVWRSMGQLRYLSAMALADAVVGNSSSGLYEAPSLSTPTLNIGGRQQGRPRPSSVVDCAPGSADILLGLEEVLQMKVTEAESPYGDGRAVGRILRALSAEEDWSKLLRKEFFGLEVGS